MDNGPLPDTEGKAEKIILSQENNHEQLSKGMKVQDMLGDQRLVYCGKKGRINGDEQ